MATATATAADVRDRPMGETVSFGVVTRPRRACAFHRATVVPPSVFCAFDVSFSVMVPAGDWWLDVASDLASGACDGGRLATLLFAPEGDAVRLRVYTGMGWIGDSAVQADVGRFERGAWIRVSVGVHRDHAIVALGDEWHHRFQWQHNDRYGQGHGVYLEAWSASDRDCDRDHRCIHAYSGLSEATMRVAEIELWTHRGRCSRRSKGRGCAARADIGAQPDVRCRLDDAWFADQHTDPRTGGRVVLEGRDVLRWDALTGDEPAPPPSLPPGAARPPLQCLPLLERGPMADVALRAGDDDDPDGAPVAAHRAVLAYECPYFEGVFRGGTTGAFRAAVPRSEDGPATAALVVPDCGRPALEALVRALYGASIERDDFGSPDALFHRWCRCRTRVRDIGESGTDVPDTGSSDDALGADGSDADGSDADGSDADGSDADGSDADGSDADGSDAGSGDEAAARDRGAPGLPAYGDDDWAVMVEELIELACLADMVGAERVARVCAAALLREGAVDRTAHASARTAHQTADVLAALPRTQNCLAAVRDACVARLAFRRDVLAEVPGLCAKLEEAGTLAEIRAEARRMARAHACLYPTQGAMLYPSDTDDDGSSDTDDSGADTGTDDDDGTDTDS